MKAAEAHAANLKDYLCEDELKFLYDRNSPWTIWMAEKVPFTLPHRVIEHICFDFMMHEKSVALFLPRMADNCEIVAHLKQLIPSDSIVKASPESVQLTNGIELRCYIRNCLRGFNLTHADAVVVFMPTFDMKTNHVITEVLLPMTTPYYFRLICLSEDSILTGICCKKKEVVPKLFRRNFEHKHGPQPFDREEFLKTAAKCLTFEYDVHKNDPPPLIEENFFLKETECVFGPKMASLAK